MKRMAPLIRYQLRDAAKAILPFYAVVTLLMVLPMHLINFTIEWNGTNLRFNAFGIATAIFLFVLGLNSFRAGYLFAVGNGFTRRQFHRAASLVLLAVATVMSLVDVGVSALTNAIWAGQTIRWPMCYPNNAAAALEVWHWVLNLAVVMLGLCLTVAYYRLGTLGKWLLSLSPVFLIGLLIALSGIVNVPAVGSAVYLALMGLSGPPNALIGALSLAVLAAVLLALSALLIRRAPVKEQED